MSVVAELKRRNVVRVAVLFGLAAWLILQVADVLVPALGLPDWVMRLIALLLLLGFPLVLIFSWVYELTPEGLKKQQEVDLNQSITHETGRKINYLIGALAVLAIVMMAAERFIPRTEPIPAATEAASAAPPAESPVQAAVKSIAVLPFVNMSGDPATEYFSDGLSEEILNTLAGIEGLKVAARTAALQFKGRGADIGEIGEKLNVGAVLEGSVRKAGESVRISAQLVDVTNGYRIWSKTFDRTATDVFAVQTEIAGEIADALQLEIGAADGGSTPARIRELPTDDPLAYELFLQGRHLWRQRNGPSVTRSIELLVEAVDRDPQFAEAHAALASAYTVLATYQSVDATMIRARALAAADRALALDGSLSEAIAVQASALQDTRQWEAAERRFQEAITLNGDDATAHHWLAVLYGATGYLHEFSSEIERAYQLDRTNAAIAAATVRERHFAGDTVGAVRRAELAASMGNANSLATELAQTLYEAGRPDEALKAMRRGYAAIGLGTAFADTIHAAVLDPARRPAARRAIFAAPRQFYSANIRISDLLRIGEFEVAVNEVLEASDAVPSDLFEYVWYKSRADLRQTAAFKRFAREAGLVAYWRERGWPDLCRPQGEDFVCN